MFKMPHLHSTEMMYFVSFYMPCFGVSYCGKLSELHELPGDLVLADLVGQCKLQPGRLAGAGPSVRGKVSGLRWIGTESSTAMVKQKRKPNGMNIGKVGERDRQSKTNIEHPHTDDN